ncbi:hypothetical protein [Xylophilus sp. GOD-11R]|uniref:hypothetical protein n=1 Tax=Xylophilus sp. GOD-11R TaxID=3089814 RepID=UPI00298C8CF8|nr:hypothetical protein [Xylophilus sp. GOD-11R]WPB57543.1 hypothetical protein R9X41_02480 [Xylophilus sp. GOD-11R]
MLSLDQEKLSDIRPRIERRQDLFVKDIPRIQTLLNNLPRIPRPYSHTITVFLRPDGPEEWNHEAVLRLRLYANLPSVNHETLSNLLQGGLNGTLQQKLPDLPLMVIGKARLQPNACGKLQCLVGAQPYLAHSIRVAKRLHYAYGDEIDESRRLTLDLERALFSVRPQGRLQFLGDMGPRLEIKGNTPQDIESAALVTGLPAQSSQPIWRGLELVFQELLKYQLVHDTEGYPEIERKFEVPGAIDQPFIDAVLAAAQPCHLLLPFPHYINRVRRYHTCWSETEGEHTVVEVPSGRLSLKIKRQARSFDGVLVRNTVASFTTARDGATETLDTFLARHRLNRLNSFEKRQTKIPISVPSGNAYILSFDKCRDAEGLSLHQLELEYIGGLNDDLPSVESVVHDLQKLSNTILEKMGGDRLLPTQRTKHQFYSDRAAPGAGRQGPR